MDTKLKSKKLGVTISRRTHPVVELSCDIGDTVHAPHRPRRDAITEPATKTRTITLSTLLFAGDSHCSRLFDAARLSSGFTFVSNRPASCPVLLAVGLALCSSLDARTSFVMCLSSAGLYTMKKIGFPKYSYWVCYQANRMFFAACL